MAELKPIHLRHQDVRDNQVNRLSFQMLECLQTVAGADHFEPVRSPHHFDQVAVFRIVIYTQNPHGDPCLRKYAWSNRSCCLFAEHFGGVSDGYAGSVARPTQDMMTVISSR
jgi:hypothetical protein